MKKCSIVWMTDKTTQQKKPYLLIKENYLIKPLYLSEWKTKKAVDNYYAIDYYLRNGAQEPTLLVEQSQYGEKNNFVINTAEAIAIQDNLEDIKEFVDGIETRKQQGADAILKERLEQLRLKIKVDKALNEGGGGL